MTRINTNVSSLVAQNRLNSTNNDLQTSLTRLSTGLRINTGKDDPAGLIASEALRSDITGINKAISNTQRASQIIATADSALGQVSSLLNDVRGLVVEAANNGALSDDEIAANQLQVDSSLEAINRIAQTTSFQGRRLLDGSLDFVTQAGTGFDSAKSLQIDQANLGAAGSIGVNIDIGAAATRATVSSSGIPPATTAVKSSGTVTFGSPTPDAEATGTVALANSYTIGDEATASLSFANSFTPNAEAGGLLTLGSSGAAIQLDAVDGGIVDGEVGNGVIVNITTVANGTASSGTFDAGTNTLNLVVEEGVAGTQIATDLAADANINGIILASAGNGTLATSADAGVQTGVLSGGSNTVAGAGFDLTAVNGGAADGLAGNSTDIITTSGATNSASYDADTNVLTLTVAAGATLTDIANTINADVGADFLASNTVNGDYSYDTADNATLTGPLSGGTNPVAAGQFTLTATNGGAADGTVGNAASLIFQSGATTGAAYDADTNALTVTVADGATVDQVAAAINTDGTFVANGILNGTSLFSATDNGTTTPLSGGSDTIVDDVITVTADNATAANDGPTISLVADNSLAAGQATAAIDGSGNIVVNVSNNGAVSIGSIATAIDDLDGFGASITASAGDGSYDIVNDTAATTTPLTGGVFGGGLVDDLVVQLTGTTGSEVFQFDAGATLADVVQSINLVSDATGITAEDDGGNLKLNSSAYGSDSLIAVEVISEGPSGTFESGLSAARANGTDIEATVNGTKATGKGNTLSINTSTLDLSLTVDDGSSTSVNFDITGGGALFQLGGDVVSNQQARLGIGSLSTAKLGGSSGRLYELGSGQTKALATDTTGAGKVIDEVINKVTSLRGRLGAFQATTLDSNLVSLNDTVANLTEAESSIRDADFAAESARLTRAQILVQSGTSVLGIANQNPQNVLSLLR